MLQSQAMSYRRTCSAFAWTVLLMLLLTACPLLWGTASAQTQSTTDKPHQPMWSDEAWTFSGQVRLYDPYARLWLGRDGHHRTAVAPGPDESFFNSVLTVADDAPPTDEASDSAPTATHPLMPVDGCFTELLPSWNAVLAPGAGESGTDDAWSGGVGFEFAVRDAAEQKWSPWLNLGHWGQRPPSLSTTTEFDGGRVRIDVLELDRPADAFRLRVVFNPGDAQPPRLHRLVVVTSKQEPVPTPADVAPPWPAIDLAVPFMAQGDNAEAIRSLTCSPTATGMVMAYRGVVLPAATHAAGVHDPQHEIYGNWGRNIAWAGQHGLTAELARVRSWRQVIEHLQNDQPLVASIRFARGEFPSYPMEETDGHLVVVRGVTSDGGVILNDPGSRDRGEGLIVDADELANAWFAKGGVAYVIGR